MKIDAHQHFWKYNPREFGWINDSMSKLKRDHLPSELLRVLTAARFDGSIAVQARQNLKETSWLLQLAGENQFIKGVVGWVNLCSENVEEQLEGFVSNRKFVGVRHVLHDEPEDDFMLGKGFCSGIKSLAKFNLAYDLLVFPRHLIHTVAMVRQFPQQRFILDHLAKPSIKDGILEPWSKEIKLLAAFPNVYCKVSGMVTEADWQQWQPSDFKPYLDVVFEAFGTDRIMIGSDWPVCTIAGSYSEVINLVENYISSFSEEEKNAIMGENAARFYRLI